MGRKKQIDTSMYFCPHTDCPNYGKVGPDNQDRGRRPLRQSEYPTLEMQRVRPHLLGATRHSFVRPESQRGDLLRRDCLPGRRERD